MADAMKKKLACPIFGAPEELPNNMLATYLNIMKYYYEIKRCLACAKKNYNQSFTEIAENVTNEIEKLWVRYLLTNLKEVVDPGTQRNSLLAHPKNILIAMITDDKEHVQELELRRITKARRISTTRSLGQFRLPILKFCVRRLPGN